MTKRAKVHRVSDDQAERKRYQLSGQGVDRKSECPSILYSLEMSPSHPKSTGLKTKERKHSTRDARVKTASFQTK